MQKCLKGEYLGRIEYDFQKSRVTCPWDHKVSVSAKKVKKKFSCLCTFKQNDYNVTRHDYTVKLHDFNVKQHEYNVKQHDYNVTWHDYTVKWHDHNVKRHDYIVKRHDYTDKRNDYKYSKYHQSKANQVWPKLREIEAKQSIALNFTGSNREQRKLF